MLGGELPAAPVTSGLSIYGPESLCGVCAVLIPVHACGCDNERIIVSIAGIVKKNGSVIRNMCAELVTSRLLACLAVRAYISHTII